MAEQTASEGAKSGNRPTVDAFEPFRDLRCELSVELLIPEFCVRDLVRLGNDMVIDTRWKLGREVPVLVNGELVAWSEFEAVGGRLAVRLTELA